MGATSMRSAERERRRCFCATARIGFHARTSFTICCRNSRRWKTWPCRCWCGASRSVARASVRRRPALLRRVGLAERLDHPDRYLKLSGGASWSAYRGGACAGGLAEADTRRRAHRQSRRPQRRAGVLGLDARAHLRELGTSLVVVTHRSARLAARMERVLEPSGGRHLQPCECSGRS